VKPLAWTDHVRTAMTERALDPAWVERVVRSPDWRRPDPDDSTVERRYAVLPERDGRILRVACRETDTAVEIITAFLDRNARRPT